MIKKIAGLGIAVSGLLLASPVFGASTILSWDATNTTNMMAWVGQVWTDFSSPVIIVLGVAIGFVVIRKVIGLVKGGVR